jgi:chaperonin GroES
MSQIQPLDDRVVAEPIEASDKTAAGLFLPSDAKEKPQMAKVIAVGKNVKEVKKGDTILHGQYSSNEVKLDGKEYVILKEEDILAVVK